MPRELTFKQLHAKLTALAKDEVPGVFARSINRVAKAAHGAQLRALDSKFTLRNKFTRGSMMLWEARPNKDPNKINAITGSRSPYLGVQETGGTEVGKDGKPTMTTPSKASRRGNWAKPIVSRFRWGSIGRIARRGPRGMTPKGAKAFVLGPGPRLSQETIFMRVGKKGKLVRIRTINRGKTMLKATKWHSGSIERVARREVMEASFAHEAYAVLGRMGAS